MPLFGDHLVQVVIMALKVASKGKRLGKFDIHTSIALPQHTPHTHELTEVFLLLSVPCNLLQIGFLLGNTVVAYRGRHENQIVAKPFFNCLNQNGQKPELRQNEFPSATPPPFYEKFYVVAQLDH